MEPIKPTAVPKQVDIPENDGYEEFLEWTAEEEEEFLSILNTDDDGVDL